MRRRLLLLLLLLLLLGPASPPTRIMFSEIWGNVKPAAPTDKDLITRPTREQATTSAGHLKATGVTMPGHRILASLLRVSSTGLSVIIGFLSTRRREWSQVSRQELGSR